MTEKNVRFLNTKGVIELVEEGVWKLTELQGSESNPDPDPESWAEWFEDQYNDANEVIVE